MVTWNMLRTHEAKYRSFGRKQIRIVTTIDLIKCLKQITEIGLFL